jgi:DNA mismatch repair protein MutL
MSHIDLLSNETIDKIAAGEVVEKPVNVVKELVENSIDAGATVISIEIKGGGTDLIRVTDNGSGIPDEDCKMAFVRHATSKLKDIKDLETLNSLGFRGEALSSVSAVSKCELITKRPESLLGTRIVCEGGKLLEKSEVGAPNGTTLIVRQLFYNTPARRKFLKSEASEGATIADMMEKIALSHPEISFQFIMNGKTRLSTGGSNDVKDVVYRIFGKDVYSSLLPVDYEDIGIKITGFTAKPEFVYRARNGELYFVNGRTVISKTVRTAIEEVYRNYLMQHQFPFCVLYIDIDPSKIDVNVHPRKTEIKFDNDELVIKHIMEALNEAFKDKDLIPKVTLDPAPEAVENTVPAKENVFSEDVFLNDDKPLSDDTSLPENTSLPEDTSLPEEPPIHCTETSSKTDRIPEPFEEKRFENLNFEKAPKPVQESFFEKKLISDEPIKEYKIIGQVFDTYWLITLDSDLYIVDQHAAHEKVNYEHFLKIYNESGEAPGQLINPPIVFDLQPMEEACLNRYMDVFTKVGYEIEAFGMGSYAIRAIPLNLYGSDNEEFFTRLLNELMEKEGVYPASVVLEKLASMSCKAAIKGNQRISALEMSNLMKLLMKLDNPYNCPHGRPVFIRITQTELEKKFKRIV